MTSDYTVREITESVNLSLYFKRVGSSLGARSSPFPRPLILVSYGHLNHVTFFNNVYITSSSISSPVGRPRTHPYFHSLCPNDTRTSKLTPVRLPLPTHTPSVTVVVQSFSFIRKSRVCSTFP